MSDESKTRRITTEFNIAMFVFSAVLGFLGFCLSERAKNVPLEGLILTTALDAVRYIVVLLIVAYFVREFWERLISDLLPVRVISYAEAIAIGLRLGILFSR